jgi:hypothetical protein
MKGNKASFYQYRLILPLRKFIPETPFRLNCIQRHNIQKKGPETDPGPFIYLKENNELH